MKTLSVLCLLLSAILSPLAAQEAQMPLATRAYLQSELTRLANDPGAAVIRARLENGDFQVGDQIFVQVQGDSVLTDTFTIVNDVELPLPALGSVPLKGVLRSELKDKVTTYLAQYLKNPAVEVRPLIRVVIEGQVNRPGYYAAAPEQPLAEVIDAAGGFTQQAKVTDIKLQRGKSTVMSGRSLQDALGQGFSLDRLSMRPGDRVYVPQRGDSERTLRIIGLVLAVPLSILAVSKVF